ncbi:GGDEF domain-containing protein [Mycoplasmopsis glycophila]|uniref:Putative bifunctional signaling protein/50S ribosomal protein L9 n=1 Tax=Mycoplasmopsis glycophila TaxID=171285 RepID=A0A449AV89_9BACT|nr:DHH family phosphoesterase [Mycoplasmopsis glycophila]VEU70398.1 putative bifunctional signaling protein/50S ribosomal protein L9 [Mycoplasmopsis glycophila]
MIKKQKNLIFLLGIISCLIIMIVFIVALIKSDKSTWASLFFAVGIITILIFTSILLYFAIYNFTKSRELIKKSFNNFIEEIMTNNNIGIIVYNLDQKIIWSSNFIKNEFSSEFIGNTVEEFFDKLSYKLTNDWKVLKNKIEFANNGNFYEAQFWPISNTIVIRDISTEQLFKREAWEQSPVIGEIEIDNFQLFQSILSEEQIFTINKIVVDVLKEYVSKYNFVYRQYTNGKFVVFTNENSLQQMIKEEFNGLMDISKRIKNENIDKLSLSVGFAHGWSSFKEKIEQAKKALVQAQNRGGDQVTIFSNIEPPIYFGSNSEILSDNSRTEIKQIAYEFEKALLNKEIKNVIVYGHALADLDALGACMGIYETAKAYGKNSYIGSNTFDFTTEKVVKQLTEKDKDKFSSMFIKNNLQAKKITNSNTIVVIVDTSDPERTDNPESIINANRENIFVFDHHRISKAVDYCSRKNVYINTSASSASEIVAELISFLDYKVDLSTSTAQVLLSGIYLDTTIFTKAITPRTFQAAAWLESKGANGIKSSQMLKIDEETNKQINEIIANVAEIKKGYYLAYTDQECSNDVISIAANEILKIEGRLASFVVAKLKGTKYYKLSARGIETNVQIICEAVGGGGHFSTAAATSGEDLETFIDNIKHAITTIGRNK